MKAVGNAVGYEDDGSGVGYEVGNEVVGYEVGYEVEATLHAQCDDGQYGGLWLQLLKHQLSVTAYGVPALRPQLPPLHVLPLRRRRRRLAAIRRRASATDVATSTATST